MAQSRSESSAPQDPRKIRSRKALIAAVLELASEQPIHKLTVRAITERAGVDRTTFYHHAETPEALLRYVLAAELEEIFAEFEEGVVKRDSVWSQSQDTGLRILLTHVSQRREIYQSSLRNGNENLIQRVLGTYFLEKARFLFDGGLYPFPNVDRLSSTSIDFAARSVSGALVGSITWWLLQPEPLDEEEFLVNVHRFFPTWFTGLES